MATNVATMGFDLQPVDWRIVEELREGRNVPSNIADNVDMTRQYVSQRLKLLEAAGYVENVGRGVYGLVSDPAEESDE
jgi:ArsR family transcriptional regulator, cadmium/lead-responsive transcriptional repressor